MSTRHRSIALLIALLAVAAFAAGCSSAASPGWTYAPPPPATPTPAPTEAPPSQSAAPSGESAAPSDGSAAPSDGAGDVLTLVAQNIQFDKTELSAPADTPFTLRLDNQDAGVPHNVEIRDSMGMSLWKGDIFNGVEVRDYAVPALPAGTYTFVCSVHPNMVGTITIGG